MSGIEARILALEAASGAGGYVVSIWFEAHCPRCSAPCWRCQTTGRLRDQRGESVGLSLHSAAAPIPAHRCKAQPVGGRT